MSKLILIDDETLEILANAVGGTIAENLRTDFFEPTFNECANYFAAKQDDTDKAYVARAPSREGELEIDPNAIVSRSDDGGAYVMAWLWVQD